MLPKKKRVTKVDFQVLMKEGKTFSTPLFLFYYVERGAFGSVNTSKLSERRHSKGLDDPYYKKSENPHYIFVAPKNPFKNAVIRNKYRRIGYNIVRTIPLKPGFGIFIYKKQAILATQAEIKENVIFILKKTGFA